MTDSNKDAAVQDKLEEFVSEKRLQRLESVLSTRTTSLTVVLDDVRNGHNISAVLRSADTFGLVDIHLVGKPPFDFSRGVSLGSERWMRLHHHHSPASAIQILKSTNFKLAALQSEEISARYNKPSLSVCDLPFKERLALVFGNEHSGLSDEFLQAADYFAHIPMLGFAESLNVSVACAICLFLSNLKKAEFERQPAMLSDLERNGLRTEWLTASIPNGESVLREVEERLSKSK